MNFLKYLLNYRKWRLASTKDQIRDLEKVINNYFEESDFAKSAINEMSTEEKINEVCRLLYNFVNKEEFERRKLQVKLCMSRKAKLEKWLEKNQERIEKI